MNITLYHGEKMHELGKESGYHTALHHIEMWAIGNDLMNKPLFEEISRLRTAAYKANTEEKEDSNAVNG